MTDISTWRDQLLSALLRRISRRLGTLPVPVVGPSDSGATFGQRALILDDEELISLSAVAPHATNAALALLDAALARTPLDELFDDAGEPRANPRPLRGIVTVFFAEHDGRALMKVRSVGARGKVSSSAPHLVLISGLHLTGNAEDSVRRLSIGSAADDDAAGGEPYFLCSCRAYEYKHAGEYHCKHVIAGALAAAANLVGVSIVSDAEFVGLLTTSPAPD